MGGWSPCCAKVFKAAIDSLYPQHLQVINLIHTIKLWGPILRFNHIGIPTTSGFEGEIPLPELKMTVSDHKNNTFGIQWQRYDADAPYPEIVKTIPHVAFEVDDLSLALEGQKVIIEPNSPIKGLVVAFIEVNGAPVELMEVDRDICEENI